MGEERKIGVQIGSGNFALASFRVIGQFASADVIRLSDGRGTYPLLPSAVFLPDGKEQGENGRSAKLKWVKLANQVYSPVKLLAEGKQKLQVGDYDVSLQDLISQLVAELRDQAGLFGDFSRCSVAFPDYLSSEQLTLLKSAVRMEIPEIEDRNFVPTGFAVLLDMQMHPARYNLGYHKFDFVTPQKVLVVDVGENFTTASLFALQEKGQDLEASYLAKPCICRVGGRDFDIRFAEYLLDQAVLEGTIGEQDFTPELKRQVEVDAEKFKRDLVEKVDAQVISTHVPPAKFKELTVPIRTFAPGGKKLLDQEISKQDYETAVFGCVAAIREGEPCVFQAITEVLNLASLNPSDIDEIVLVGGMARVHLLGQLFKHVFGKTPREFANPELCAVRGASIYHDMVSSTLEIRL